LRSYICIFFYLCFNHPIMLTYNYTLYFVLPLLATVAKGNWKKTCSNIKSFEDVAYFNTTSSVVSAEGFVESFTIPDGWQGKDNTMALGMFEYANATVTLYNNGVKTKHYPGLNEPITFEVQGTDKNAVNWPGYNATEAATPPDHGRKEVDFATFMDYFAAGGAGVVIDLENYSTLTAIGDFDGKLYGVAQPKKMYKVAIAVLHTVELTMNIPHANVFTFTSTQDSDYAPLWWTDDVRGDVEVRSNELGVGGLMEGGVERQNTCIDYRSVRSTPAPTSAPTSRPTADASGSVSARYSGWMAILSLFAALLTLS